jgi:hypothetical protein
VARAGFAVHYITYLVWELPFATGWPTLPCLSVYIFFLRIYFSGRFSVGTLVLFIGVH